MNVKRYFRKKQRQIREARDPKAQRRSPLTELENLQVLIAWRTGEISREQAEEFIDTDNLPELWRQAVEQGRGLVR